jgi:lipoate-protein ligase A
MARWFLLVDRSPLPAAVNMARDEHLFERCHRQKLGFLRLYSWQIPTFSFGVSQRIEKVVNLDFVRSRRLDYVRRITGGKTVLHDDEITYAVASSEDIFYRDHDLYKSYLLISRALVQAFRSLNIDAVLAEGSSGGLARSNNPCFSFPTPNEIEIGGKKIVGSAQKRDKHALLQHGSIPVTMDHSLYAEGAHFEAGVLKGSMTTLSEAAPVSREDLLQALIGSFQEFVGQPLETYEPEENEDQHIARLTEKYRSRDWNHRL